MNADVIHVSKSDPNPVHVQDGVGPKKNIENAQLYGLLVLVFSQSH